MVAGVWRGYLARYDIARPNLITRYTVVVTRSVAWDGSKYRHSWNRVWWTFYRITIFCTQAPPINSIYWIAPSVCVPIRATMSRIGSQEPPLTRLMVALVGVIEPRGLIPEVAGDFSVSLVVAEGRSRP